MINHIFKIIWNERKINIWLLIEFTLIFCILWFCCDYIFFTVKRYFQPKGYNTERIYSIDIGNDEKRKKALNINDIVAEGGEANAELWAIYDRIKRHPAVEHIGLSLFAVPYGGYTMDDCTADSVTQNVHEKCVTSGYFDLFDIKILSGRPFDESDITSKSCIISAGSNNLFANKPAEKIKQISFRNENYNVIGVTNRFKQSEYEKYSCTLYSPLSRDNNYISHFRDLYVKVKPDADKNFAEEFKKDMKNQLSIGNYYLKSVTPIAKGRDNYMTMRGYESDLKSVYSITAFLFINVLLIVVAIFWFRLQSRQSEIGLRMALGASRANIKSMFWYRRLDRVL